MLDLLLIYPPISVNQRYGRNVGKIGGLQPPLGLAYLAAYVRDKGFSVKIIDVEASVLNWQDFVELVKKGNPRVVGIGALTSILARAVDFSQEYRKIAPDVLIVIGGHHASIMPEETLRDNECFDILCKGEGEYALAELLAGYKNTGFDRNKFLSNFELLKSIPGIVFRKDGQVISNNNPELIKDLDVLPFPARDLLNMDAYKPLPNQYKRLPLLNMTISRGCPYECIYCSANPIFGRRIRMRSADKTVEEIERLIKDYGAREISFWDDTLTFNKKWLSRFCSLILEKKIDITWTCYSRVDTVNLEMLRLMKEAGCWNIFFGVESGDQKILDTIGKGTTIEQIRNACKMCKQVGIEVRASFMLALPQETPEMAKKTINFAIELDPDYAQFCITTPFPRTRLYEEAKKYGFLDTDFSKYTVWQPIFVPFGYKNREEILKMERLAVRRFYLRPRYLINKLRKIRSLEDVIRYIKGFRVILGFIK